jgi:frataxin-like iron-binding protein CyaY
LSSPVSGPYHFALQDTKWKSRSGSELYQLLSHELQIKIE